MKQAPIWVMRVVVVLEGMWFALVLFLFNFRVPEGIILIICTWIMLIAALYLFASRKPIAAICLTYTAVIAGALLLGFGGGGPPHFFQSLYRDAPNFVFLIAAHYAYKETHHPGSGAVE